MNEVLIKQRALSAWLEQYPLLKDLIDYKEISWFNPAILPYAQGVRATTLSKANVDEAAARLERFAPLIQRLFPETASSGGLIESPLRAIPRFQGLLADRLGTQLAGNLFLKLDSELPISGSIKARGGIYEVLVYAEQLALEAGLLTTSDNYAVLADEPCRHLFSQHTIAVGSTGNLGLSIGTMSAKLGFKSIVHMSTEARQWKKEKLREQGVIVVEHNTDYSQAVAAGRAEAELDPRCHFVDDENSTHLFLGYAVAARRLAQQLQNANRHVDAEHPLFVHLPCGVGGGPGGLAFGLKTQFGDHVHCIFAEPTHCPSMLLGVYTGEHDEICVQDFGLDNLTIADGLACGRPSGFVGKAMQFLIDGYYTVSDEHLSQLLYALYTQENLFIEPSSTAGLVGIQRVIQDPEYLERIGMTQGLLNNATHIAWATGGSLVPSCEKDNYIRAGSVGKFLD